MGIALNDIFLLQDCLTMTASVVPLGTVGRDLSGGWMAVAYSAHPHIPHLNAVSQEQVKAAFNKFKSDLPSGNLTQLLEITIFNGKIHYKWPFSITMLNYQRVDDLENSDRYRFNQVHPPAEVSQWLQPPGVHWRLFRSLVSARNVPWHQLRTCRRHCVCCLGMPAVAQSQGDKLWKDQRSVLPIYLTQLAPESGSMMINVDPRCWIRKNSRDIWLCINVWYILVYND